MHKTIRDTLLALAKKQILIELIKKAPFLAMPVISPLAGLFIGYLLGIIIDKTILGINFIKIDWELDSDVEEVNKAVDKANKAIKEEDVEKIKESENELIEAARRLIRIGRTFT